MTRGGRRHRNRSSTHRIKRRRTRRGGRASLMNRLFDLPDPKQLDDVIYGYKSFNKALENETLLRAGVASEDDVKHARKTVKVEAQRLKDALISFAKDNQHLKTQSNHYLKESEKLNAFIT